MMLGSACCAVQSPGARRSVVVAAAVLEIRWLSTFSQQRIDWALRKASPPLGLISQASSSSCRLNWRSVLGSFATGASIQRAPFLPWRIEPCVRRSAASLLPPFLFSTARMQRSTSPVAENETLHGCACRRVPRGSWGLSSVWPASPHSQPSSCVPPRASTTGLTRGRSSHACELNRAVSILRTYQGLHASVRRFNVRTVWRPYYLWAKCCPHTACTAPARPPARNCTDPRHLRTLVRTDYLGIPAGIWL
jgi:hypothetical protein